MHVWYQSVAGVPYTLAKLATLATSPWIEWPILLLLESTLISSILFGKWPQDSVSFVSPCIGIVWYLRYGCTCDGLPSSHWCHELVVKSMLDQSAVLVGGSLWHS